MKITGVGLLVAAACVVLLGAQGRADETLTGVRFAAPQRILAGEAHLGAGRLYPSPVLHDVDGDGLLDIVVGDLPGRVTFAPRVAGKLAFGTEKPFLDRDGKPLKFHNW